MKQSYKDVNHSPLNTSKSKQTFAFSQASRFPKLQSTCSKHAYNINKSMLDLNKTFNQTFSKTPKGYKLVNEITPSPGQYNKLSLTDISIAKKKGFTFGNDQRLKLDVKGVPGPGTYKNQIYNPEKQLSYTMRVRTKKQQKPLIVGPGSYNLDKNNMTSMKVISSFKNSSYAKLSLTSSRFNNKLNTQPGPGHYQWEKIQEVSRKQSEPVSKFSATGKYSFGKQSRNKQLTYELVKKTQPGPGLYNTFSQFANLNKSSL